MESASSKPNWQSDDCPAWCVSQHREDDLPEDRFHDSAPVCVPAAVPDDSANQSAQLVELHIVTSRRCGSQDDWVFIGQPDLARRGLTVSPESAGRLGSAISSHVATP